MNELSLFTGAGGGLLGTHLLGWRPIGYVEFNDYCQRVIAQRIKDGILPAAPIFGDVREFVQSGAAAQYRGFADVVTGGFPCQPFSVAGKQLGADDERNMWPATIATIRAVRPRFCFLENVPGLVNSGYFGAILGDLAESGYDTRWRILSAAELGAPHQRDRLWIVAHAAREQGGWIQQPELSPHVGAGCQGAMAYTQVKGLSQRQGSSISRERQSRLKRSGVSHRWWEVEPALGRVVDGYAGRVDELKAIGNAQVASVAAAAWRLLTEDLL